jgi:hypothetical protein
VRGGRLGLGVGEKVSEMASRNYCCIGKEVRNEGGLRGGGGGAGRGRPRRPIWQAIEHPLLVLSFGALGEQTIVGVIP